METFLEKNRREACQWAAEMLKKNFLILDTETTGLTPGHEIVEVAVVDSHGRRRFESRVNPTVEMTGEAFRTHGIHPTALMLAPRMEDIEFGLKDTLRAAEVILVFHPTFDREKINQSFHARHLPPLDESLPFADVQYQYARYIGKWDDKRNDFKWQKLPAGNHTAYGDCLATLKILQEMAAGADIPESQA